MAAADGPNPPESLTVTGRGVDPDRIVERLDRVHDPELDRSIVELEYVDRLDIDGSAVTVEFVLPTAWCSPAFAWMMATGIRDEVEALAAVESATVQLRDHMHGQQIAAGVNEDRAFEDVFDDAEDGIDDVRESLDEKARFARQYEAMTAFGEAGLDDAQIATVRPVDIDLEAPGDRAVVVVRDGSVAIPVPTDPVERYLEKARSTGVVAAEDEPLFADRTGEPFGPSDVETVRRDARLAAANIEGQATICASLHEARNGVAPGDMV